MKNCWSPENPSCTGAVFPAERRAVSVVRSGDSRNVGDVLGQRLLAVQGEIGERLVGVILRGEFRGGGFEVCEIGGRPPVAHTALGVKRAPSESKVWLISCPMTEPMAP